MAAAGRRSVQAGPEGLPASGKGVFAAVADGKRTLLLPTPMGLRNFRKRLRKACPWLKFGYFNPYLEDRA